MADNYLKLPLQSALNKLAVSTARKAIESEGSALPCRVVAVSGSIVTVAFEVNSSRLTLPQVTIPKAESNWIRTPTQIGDFGFTVPADVYLGGVSGLGGGIASMTKPGNLSALVFVPISNKASPPIDQNAAQVQGPNGAIIQTTTGTTSSAVINQSGATFTYGSNTLTINSSGITMVGGGKTVTLNSSGLTIDGILFETHHHGGVTTGSGFTLGPS
jgi:hypothetical protein